jgi:hypothetical protein
MNPEQFYTESYRSAHSVISKENRRIQQFTFDDLINFAGSYNKAKLRQDINDFYDWLDNLSQDEYDDMTLTEKIEKFLVINCNG